MGPLSRVGALLWRARLPRAGGRVTRPSRGRAARFGTGRARPERGSSGRWWRPPRCTSRSRFSLRILPGWRRLRTRSRPRARRSIATTSPRPSLPSGSARHPTRCRRSSPRSTPTACTRPGQRQLALDSGDGHRRRAVAGVLDLVLADRALERQDRDRQPAGAVARHRDRVRRPDRHRAEHAVGCEAAARAGARRERAGVAAAAPCRHRRTAALPRGHLGGHQPGRVHRRPDRLGLWTVRALSVRGRERRTGRGRGADRRDPRARALRPGRHRRLRAVLRGQRAVRRERRGRRRSGRRGRLRRGRARHRERDRARAAGQDRRLRGPEPGHRVRTTR